MKSTAKATKKIKKEEYGYSSTSSRHVLKILSLFIAISLWFYVLNSEPLEVERRVELVFITPPDLAINVEVPKHVKIKLKGSRAFVQNLDLTQEKMVIDLRDYPYEQETFAVTFDSSMVQIPFGIEILEVFPQQVVLSLEREIRKKVPIRLRTVGDMSKDLKLISKEFSPREFMIRGPYHAIKKVTLLNTLPLDLESLDGNGELKLKLEPIDSRIQIEDLKDINFYYTIKPNKANLTLQNVQVSFLSKDANYFSMTKKVSVDVLVPSERRDQIKPEDITVIGNISALGRGTHKVKLKAQLPEGVNLLKINPEEIEVKIR